MPLLATRLEVFCGTRAPFDLSGRPQRQENAAAPQDGRKRAGSWIELSRRVRDTEKKSACGHRRAARPAMRRQTKRRRGDADSSCKCGSARRQSTDMRLAAARVCLIAAVLSREAPTPSAAICSRQQASLVATKRKRGQARAQMLQNVAALIGKEPKISTTTIISSSRESSSSSGASPSSARARSPRLRGGVVATWTALGSSAATVIAASFAVAAVRDNARQSPWELLFNRISRQRALADNARARESRQGGADGSRKKRRAEQAAASQERSSSVGTRRKV